MSDDNGNPFFDIAKIQAYQNLRGELAEQNRLKRAELRAMGLDIPEPEPYQRSAFESIFIIILWVFLLGGIAFAAWFIYLVMTV